MNHCVLGLKLMQSLFLISIQKQSPQEQLSDGSYYFLSITSNRDHHIMERGTN